MGTVLNRVVVARSLTNNSVLADDATQRFECPTAHEAHAQPDLHQAPAMTIRA
jgi:hypothetical protein